MTTLVASRHYPILYESQKEHRYGVQDKRIRETEDWVGKRVGIAGYGSIGRQGESSPNQLVASEFALEVVPSIYLSSPIPAGNPLA